MNKFLKAAAVVVPVAAVAGAGAAWATDVTVTASAVIMSAPSVAVNKNLVFGQIAKPGSGSGTIAYKADASIAEAGGADAVTDPTRQLAELAITGTNDAWVQITLPQNAVVLEDVTDQSSDLTLDLEEQFVTGGADGDTDYQFTRQLSNTGSYTLLIGGKLTIPNTADNDTHNGSFTVSVMYN